MRRGLGGTMQLDVTPAAAAEVLRRGGTVAIDYIPPIA